MKELPENLNHIFTDKRSTNYTDIALHVKRVMEQMYNSDDITKRQIIENLNNVLNKQGGNFEYGLNFISGVEAKLVNNNSFNGTNIDSDYITAHEFGHLLNSITYREVPEGFDDIKESIKQNLIANMDQICQLLEEEGKHYMDQINSGSNDFDSNIELYTSYIELEIENALKNWENVRSICINTSLENKQKGATDIIKRYYDEGKYEDVKRNLRVVLESYYRGTFMETAKETDNENMQTYFISGMINTIFEGNMPPEMTDIYKKYFLRIHDAESFNKDPKLCFDELFADFNALSLYPDELSIAISFMKEYFGEDVINMLNNKYNDVLNIEKENDESKTL